MRVTQGMLSSNILKQIQNSYEKLNTYQNQLSTGKKITKPSQDPVVAMMGVSYRTGVTQIDQYKRNLNEAYTWLDNSDAALDQATQVMQRVRELTVQASNDSYKADERENIGKEIDQLRNQMATIANTKVAGRYLFNGTNTKTAPVDDQTFEVKANAQPVNIEVSQGINVPVNINANNVFPQGLYDDLKDLHDSLATADGQEISAFLDKIDSRMDAIVGERADLGARQNRMDMTANRLDQQSVIAKQVLSNNEDIDFEKVVTDLNMEESVNRAALSVGARIMQPTLVDFLK